jgi:Holliday junction DNA helicase RuvB
VKLNDLIGLPREKAKAYTAIRACRNSGIIFPHTLLYGVGGTGKTAFARAVAHELGYHFVEVEGIVFKERNVLLSFLRRSASAAKSSGRPLLLFIDEIHRLKLPLQEALYIPMKEWRMTTANGDVKLPKFTLIGATTRFDMLDPNSFVTRFENQWEIQRYSEVDIGMIVAQEFRNKQMSFDRASVEAIAKRCLGIPRIAISFVKKVMLSALSGNSRHVDLACVTHMFGLEQIDDLGLHPSHRRYLEILDKALPHPIGVGAISSKMRQPEDVVKDAVEPILLEMDFVASTPRGRVLTEEGHKYLEDNG